VSARDFKFSIEARKKMLRGIDTLAGAVRDVRPQRTQCRSRQVVRATHHELASMSNRFLTLLSSFMTVLPGLPMDLGAAPFIPVDQPKNFLSVRWNLAGRPSAPLQPVYSDSTPSRSGLAGALTSRFVTPAICL